MYEINFKREIILLFDEQGTPTFKPDRDTDWFLGVAVTYDLADEIEIFKTCNSLFGLSKKRPLKNNKISNCKAEQISTLITGLPIQTIISSVNLSNDEFRRVVTQYEQLGNMVRRKHRQVRERPIAQMLHSQILDGCLFPSIFNYTDRHLISSTFSLNVDDWSFPENDLEISLKNRSKSIEDGVNSFYEEQDSDLRVRIPPILLLKKDSPRKRFVDVVTSAISRSFKRNNDLMFSETPLQILLANKINDCKDITGEIIDFIINYMHPILINQPVG